MSFDSEVNQIPDRVEALEKEIKALRIHALATSQCLLELKEKHNGLVAALSALTEAVKGIHANSMNDRAQLDLVSLILIAEDDDSSG